MRPLTYLVVLLAFSYLLAPFLWMVGASLSSEKEFTKGSVLPHSPTGESYRTYLDAAAGISPKAEKTREVGQALGLETARNLPGAIGNSILIALCVVLINLGLGSLAAYGLARIPSALNLPLLIFYLVSRSIPAVALMIPMYLLFKGWGLLDTPIAVVLAHSTYTLPFTIWLLKGTFQSVPLDLERAARIDGCSRMKSLLRVVLPASTPGLIAAGIFAFLFSWGEFLYAYLFTTRHARPVTVVMSDFISEVDVPFPLIAAGTVIAVLVPVVLAFVFQRYIIRGIGGSVTG